ncbi:UNVERIFIED_CONTAM: putative mitochondrial protein [Sesamum calycinum]|uniref:Mitochondrial protein n=1 Tax=Sesamum calycinum TaxID=2727403 RepID=A0AAW2M2E7_9LAMI
MNGLNFCYLCGKLGHISKWCDSRFQSELVDPGENSPYGPWLRAVGRGTLGLASLKIREPQTQPQLARPRFTSRSHRTLTHSSEPKRAPPSAMSLLVWNCQGLGNPVTVKGLRDLLRVNNPHLIFLAETKCSSSQIEVLKRRLNLFGCCVDSKGRSGGLALLWQKSIEVQLQSFSSYHMDVSVRLDEAGDWWRFTGIYGELDIGKRFEFWNLLYRLHHQLEPHTVSERLDRACASESWSCLFPDTRVHHVVSPYSDHSPLVVELQLRIQWDLSGGRKCFHFEAAWLQEPACVDIVKKTWSAPQTSRAEGRLREKLSMVSARFSCWGRLYGRATRDRIKELERLLVARKQSRETQDNRDHMFSDKAELSKLILQEETFWKQRSKDLLLKEGDRNSSFFHAKASRRHQTNSIRKLRNPDGSWTETAEGVQQCILEYFQGVFTSSRPRPDDIQSGTEFLPTAVNAEMAEDLLRPYTETEITKALFGMSPLKSPGPDGMPLIFYQKFWHVVKSDVISCVLYFLNSRVLPMGFNETHIVLIPKCKQLQSLPQYRPISLCNVAYKIASKSIANRLKPWLDRIISPAQSAFVPGRLITDNVLLAFETNHFLNTHSRGRKHFMNLKLDISKAYDRVEWSFLKSGSQFGSITPQRGLRQGDPLSPYLFLLCTESLSSLFREVADRGSVPGVAVCSEAPRISHLLFADDTMVFSPADLPQCMLFARFLIQRGLAEALGLHLDNKHEVYLGLPAVAFRSKRAIFAALKDRIWKWIQGWHEKTLS